MNKGKVICAYVHEQKNDEAYFYFSFIHHKYSQLNLFLNVWRL